MRRGEKAEYWEVTGPEECSFNSLTCCKVGQRGSKIETKHERPERGGWKPKNHFMNCRNIPCESMLPWNWNIKKEPEGVKKFV